MHRAILSAALALLVTGTSGAQSRATDSSAQDLAQSLQRKYDGIKNFSAEFTHTYRGGVLKKEIVEQGRLLVKKPGKMRWQYTAPEQKLFVSDGVKMYSYIPQDKQVIVTSIPPDDQITTPTMANRYPAICPSEGLSPKNSPTPADPIITSTTTPVIANATCTP